MRARAEADSSAAHRLRALRAIDTSILRSVSFDEIASAALRDLRLTLEVPCGVITTIDAESRLSTTIAADGLFPRSFAVGTTREIPALVDIAEFVQSSRIYPLAAADAVAASPRSADIVALGMSFALLIPLLAGEELLGTLMLFAEREDDFGFLELEGADEVGRHLALALQLARGRDSERKALARAEDALARLWSLQAVSDIELARLTNDRLLFEMCKLICALLKTDGASVLLLDDTGEMLRGVSAFGLDDGMRADDVVVPVGTSVTGRVAATGKSLAIEDLDEIDDRSPAAARGGRRSAAGVPLRVGERLIGVVGVGSRVRRVYDDDDLRLLEVAAERMAAAIDRSTTELELERRVAERTAALEEANAELDAFSYSVSHDLRAPLRALRGFGRVLLEDYGAVLGAEGVGFATRIVDASDRMDELIEDLLAYSRVAREEIVAGTVDLDRIVDEVVRGLDPRAEEQNAVIEIDRPLGVVSAHSATVALVLSNLIDNALKFTAPGSPPSVRIRARATGPGVRVEVVDEGIGIADADRRKIFVVFERLHGQEAYPGTGVGLASVRKGVERTGGTVGVESELGRGSTFWFELPAASAR